MAGYIGTKAVSLSTTAADVNGDANVDGTVTADGLTVDTNTLFVDASANNVGIGTNSPATFGIGQTTLHIKGNRSDYPDRGGIVRATSYDGGSDAYFGVRGDDLPSVGSLSDHPFAFFTDNVEVARFDVSGNLLMGKTSTATLGTDTTAGHTLYSVGTARHVADQGPALQLTRTSSDGDIVEFTKDGSRVGSIFSVVGGYAAYNSGANTGYLASNGDLYYAWDTNRFYPNTDNARDLGLGSRRWDDVFATNTSIISSSDRNEKQQIASLTSAEITAAKAISKLFKTFKWNSAVASKGDNARKHTGHIAQEVYAALSDAGLNPVEYAFWCSDTWWETQTDVPAVAAVAEVLDDDGNVVTEAVEAKDAYTRTDTYETLAEAPAGATERTKQGIRYSELLAFVGAATEQRLADIETRLTALEAV